MDFYKQSFSNDECITLYSIASLNNQGRVREKALKLLIDSYNPKAIPFIVYRLADWVQEIRQIAFLGIEKYKKIEFINDLVNNLPVFEWVQQVKRTDLSSVYNDIMSFLVLDNNDYLKEHFVSYNDTIRIAIAKRMACTWDIEIDNLTMLLKDKNFIVRCMALSHFDKFTQQQIDGLLSDKSAQVRLQVLHRLKDRQNFTGIVYPFLVDLSKSIRELARYTLKNSNDDFAAIYNDNLLRNKNVLSSLYGLAETNRKEFVETVIPFLTDKSIKVRNAAFGALKVIDENRAYDFALNNLNSQHGAIRKVVVNYLSKNATDEVLQKARDIYREGQYELKKSMLCLFSNIGKWQVIADIMIGTIDENEGIRQIGVVYLRRWLDKAPSYFIAPKQEDLERANRIFQFAFELHEEKRYFDKNPVDGIDFYLR